MSVGSYDILTVLRMRNEQEASADSISWDDIHPVQVKWTDDENTLYDVLSKNGFSFENAGSINVWRYDEQKKIFIRDKSLNRDNLVGANRKDAQIDNWFDMNLKKIPVIVSIVLPGEDNHDESSEDEDEDEDDTGKLSTFVDIPLSRDDNNDTTQLNMNNTPVLDILYMLGENKYLVDIIKNKYNHIYQVREKITHRIVLVVDEILKPPYKGMKNRFVNDIMDIAKQFNISTLPGVMIQEDKYVFYQVFYKGEKINRVFRFKESIKRENVKTLCEVLLFGLKNGSFLGGKNVPKVKRLRKVLGFGTTSIVFKTSSRKWPVAKILTHSLDSSWELATRELKNTDKIFRSPYVSDTGSFLDVTIDTDRVPRTHAFPEGTPVTVTKTDTTPILYYDRICDKIKTGFFLAEHPLFSRKKQLLDACLQLHKGGIVHNDLRMDNIMIDPETNRIVIIDFGFSHYIDQTSYWEGGTISTASPVLLFELYKHPYRQVMFRSAFDLWSVASIFLLDTNSEAEVDARLAGKAFSMGDRGGAYDFINHMWSIATLKSQKWMNVQDILKNAKNTPVSEINTTYQQLLDIL